MESDFKGIKHDYYESIDKGHGRIETRQCWSVAPTLDCISQTDKWAKLNSIIMVKSKRELQAEGKVTQDTRFYISSIKPNAEKSLSSVRKHWGVENSLHWVLDVTFREDESRIRMDAAPENFAIVRQIALNIIKKDTSLKASVKRKKMMAALKDDYREVIIRQAI